MMLGSCCGAYFFINCIGHITTKLLHPNKSTRWNFNHILLSLGSEQEHSTQKNKCKINCRTPEPTAHDLTFFIHAHQLSIPRNHSQWRKLPLLAQLSKLFSISHQIFHFKDHNKAHFVEIHLFFEDIFTSSLII
jgi:hypothetical protein